MNLKLGGIANKEIDQMNKFIGVGGSGDDTPTAGMAVEDTGDNDLLK